MKMLKKYLLYLTRWQLSTPILSIVLILLHSIGPLWATIVANLIGGLIFFWIDKLIFRRKAKLPLWEIKENVCCNDCGTKDTCYRIVSWGKYDKSEDSATPRYRCKKCSIKKMNTIKS